MTDNMLTLQPLSLYVHVPWCVRKCPYCDFNSHQKQGELPEAEYIEALLQDLQQADHLTRIVTCALGELNPPTIRF